MMFAIGFMVTFLFGGLTGVMLACPPMDFHVSDTYFLVAHFHYVLFGTIVFATYAGIYFWFPKMTGRMLDERLGKLHFWLTFIGFHTDIPRAALARRRGHAPPLRRLPAHRRVHTLNTMSTIGAFILGAVDAAVHMERVPRSATASRHRRRSVGLRQLPGVGDQLPAAPAQLHRAAPHPLRAPAFDLHHPEYAQRRRDEPHTGRRSAPSERVAQRTSRESHPDARST